jgi:hypothetical protein
VCVRAVGVHACAHIYQITVLLHLVCPVDFIFSFTEGSHQIVVCIKYHYTLPVPFIADVCPSLPSPLLARLCVTLHQDSAVKWSVFTRLYSLVLHPVADCISDQLLQVLIVELCVTVWSNIWSTLVQIEAKNTVITFIPNLCSEDEQHICVHSEMLLCFKWPQIVWLNHFFCLPHAWSAISSCVWSIKVSHIF